MEVFEKSTATKNVSYSQIIASKASPNKETRPLKSIIITPDHHQPNYKTRYDLNKNLDLSKLRIGMEKVKNCRNGAVEINVQDCVHTQLEQEIEKICLHPTRYLNQECSRQKLK
ncbi:unnamed protein product [Acanthoscelides obtectus]|uniref:Uncharacterized protein n=1 Tax=Acanthoscelides obtectus TaxID=200917 RepID=A0A9P0Q1I2_ACAOB|nr:unnamed protein product [Acanthoscelides obtectus]CAK1675221.1 hypothetical protein AOBTE_LOCUS30064 [Acanthoscelides obtectus]